MIGFVAGHAIATAIDAGVLADESRRRPADERGASAPRPPRGLSLSPPVDVAPGRFSLGAAGAF